MNFYKQTKQLLATFAATLLFSSAGCIAGGASDKAVDCIGATVTQHGYELRTLNPVEGGSPIIMMAPDKTNGFVTYKSAGLTLVALLEGTSVTPTMLQRYTRQALQADDSLEYSMLHNLA